jgi:hypothetical protein
LPRSRTTAGVIPAVTRVLLLVDGVATPPLLRPRLATGLTSLPLLPTAILGVELLLLAAGKSSLSRFSTSHERLVALCRLLSNAASSRTKWYGGWMDVKELVGCETRRELQRDAHT